MNTFYPKRKRKYCNTIDLTISGIIQIICIFQIKVAVIVDVKNVTRRKVLF